MDTTSARAAGPVDTQSAPKQQVPWTHNLLRTGRPTPAQEVQRTQHPRGEATKTRAGGPVDSTSTRRRRRRSRETQHPRISSHDLTGRAQEVQWTQHPREQQVPRTHNLLPGGPKNTPHPRRRHAGSRSSGLTGGSRGLPAKSPAGAKGRKHKSSRRQPHGWPAH